MSTRLKSAKCWCGNKRQFITELLAVKWTMCRRGCPIICPAMCTSLKRMVTSRSININATCPHFKVWYYVRDAFTCFVLLVHVWRTFEEHLSIALLLIEWRSSGNRRAEDRAISGVQVSERFPPDFRIFRGRNRYLKQSRRYMGN